MTTRREKQNNNNQVRRSSGKCELSFYRENEMLRKSDLDAIAAAYIAAHSGDLFTYRRQRSQGGIMSSMFQNMMREAPPSGQNSNKNLDVRNRIEALGARMYVFIEIM